MNSRVEVWHARCSTSFTSGCRLTGKPTSFHRPPNEGALSETPHAALHGTVVQLRLAGDVPLGDQPVLPAQGGGGAGAGARLPPGRSRRGPQAGDEQPALRGEGRLRV